MGQGLVLRWLIVGPLETNCYIVGCERTGLCVVIDPGGNGQKVLKTIEVLGLTPIFIVNTHGHFDHTAANAYLKRATGAELLIHRADEPLILGQSRNAAFWGIEVEDSPPADRYIDEGDLIVIGDITLQVIHTPGHTPGGVSLFTDRMVFVGDTLFQGSIGRTDFPGGDYRQLISSIKEKLLPLGDDVIVYPGHGPQTTIGQERQTNPFLVGGGFHWF